MAGIDNVLAQVAALRQELGLDEFGVQSPSDIPAGFDTFPIPRPQPIPTAEDYYDDSDDSDYSEEEDSEDDEDYDEDDYDEEDEDEEYYDEESEEEGAEMMRTESGSLIAEAHNLIKESRAVVANTLKHVRNRADPSPLVDRRVAAQVKETYQDVSAWSPRAGQAYARLVEQEAEFDAEEEQFLVEQNRAEVMSSSEERAAFRTFESQEAEFERDATAWVNSDSPRRRDSAKAMSMAYPVNKILLTDDEKAAYAAWSENQEGEFERDAARFVGTLGDDSAASPRRQRHWAAAGGTVVGSGVAATPADMELAKVRREIAELRAMLSV